VTEKTSTPKAEAAKAAAAPAGPSVRMQKQVDGQEMPVVVIVPADQVDAYKKDGFSREG
jgi:hypothetical protein